jgi:adenine-specific DNA-methyltransferase
MTRKAAKSHHRTRQKTPYENAGIMEAVFFRCSLIQLTEDQEANFDLTDEEGSYRLLPFRRSGGTSTPEERPNSYYPIYYNENDKSFSLEKTPSAVEILPIDKLGKKRVWRQTRPSLLEAVKRGDMVCKKSKGNFVIYMKDRIKEGRKPKTMWTDSKYDASSNGTMLLKDIFNGEKLFSYPKSIYTVKDTVEIVSKRGGDDIILDFFGGSGTTAHAVLELNREDGGNRKFIIVEQMDYIETVTVPRVAEVLKRSESEDDFVYVELLEWNKKFIDDLEKAKTKAEIKKVKAKIEQEAFFRYAYEPEQFDNKAFDALTEKEQKKALMDMLDMNHLYVNKGSMNDATFKVSEEDKKLNAQFYSAA